LPICLRGTDLAVELLPRPFSKPLRLSRIACGDRRAAARRTGRSKNARSSERAMGASLTAAGVWKFRRQELDGEARSARDLCDDLNA
jgi:hypothetical protein